MELLDTPTGFCGWLTSGDGVKRDDDQPIPPPPPPAAAAVAGVG